MSGRPEVDSTSVIAAHPLLDVGRIAAAGTHIVCLPTAANVFPAAVIDPANAIVELATVELGVIVR
jgi:hypothetical protein